MSKKQVIIFLAVMVVITGITIWKASSLEKYGSVVLAWVTVVLVLVTAAYAYNVKRQTDANVEMTKSAKEQAEASIKMAEEMERPKLIPFFRFNSRFYPDRKVAFLAGVNNEGTGPAYDPEFWIEDDGNPPSKVSGGFVTDDKGNVISVIRGKEEAMWAIPQPRLSLPQSEKIQRRYFVTKYKDIKGVYEIRLPFTTSMTDENTPISILESINKKTIEEKDFREELP